MKTTTLFPVSQEYFGAPVREAVKRLAVTSDIETRGAIYTRPEVVAFMLDLSGYTSNKPLQHYRLLEPSVGHGEFLLEAVRRLLFSIPARKRLDAAEIKDSIRGVELHQQTYNTVRQELLILLSQEGFSQKDCEWLCDQWLIQGDFLLTPFEFSFDYIIGNPPYVRQELIDEALLKVYRSLFVSLYDRADLYIPFIERSLQLLSPKGQLNFICSDRWMKNKYGGPLRGIVADKFSLRYYIDMVDTEAFQEQVTAYPAITVITNEKSNLTRIAHRPAVESNALGNLVKELHQDTLQDSSVVKEIASVTSGSTPWILKSGDQLNLVRRLERDFPLLEEAGCKVGIGVATGADQVFIAPYDNLPVEADRKLPLATTRDLTPQGIKWKGLGVLNPFTASGQLVSLGEYPKLASFLSAHETTLKNRHVAAKNPTRWYRTIDRIDPALTGRPKLLIPDIKGEAQIVYEPGHLYPHHNLYYITSDTWDLHALQAVLQSGIARLFVGIYSTKMRGGYLRFQAQYLRRIRLPHWKDVPETLKAKLISAGKQHDIESGNQAVFSLYQLTKAEREAIGGNGI